MNSTDWKDEHRRLLPLYERLRDEVLFALRKEIARAGIKTHTLTSRVKTIDSLVEKAQRKGYTNPLAQAPDVVGARVVVLFLSDLPRVQEIVKNVFDVVRTEDRVEGGEDPQTFGYMSQHFEASLRGEHTGPRYDDLRGMMFEIQLRTLLMDAWASVSHSSLTKESPASQKNSGGTSLR